MRLSCCLQWNEQNLLSLMPEIGPFSIPFVASPAEDGDRLTAPANVDVFLLAAVESSGFLTALSLGGLAGASSPSVESIESLRFVSVGFLRVLCGWDGLLRS
jgi:hypothetical protein